MDFVRRSTFAFLLGVSALVSAAIGILAIPIRAFVDSVGDIVLTATARWRDPLPTPYARISDPVGHLAYEPMPGRPLRRQLFHRKGWVPLHSGVAIA